MIEWQAIMAGWAYAHGQPTASGAVKSQPSDFRVVENMPLEPSGSGEHTWLRIRKTKLNTEQVSKQLARCAGVSNKSVGYSGRKDYQAVTEQWFSVWLPGQADPDWLSISNDQLELLAVSRHNKKLKLGAHSSNSFEIRVRDYTASQSELDARCELISKVGIPNYFGPQRFGRGASNLQRALTMFVENKRIKDRSERGMLLSSARAWLFNECLSARVANGQWNTLSAGEPCILAGSDSYFHADQASDNDEELQARLNAGDIHPSAPLMGRWREAFVSRFETLHAHEQELCQPYADLVKGLDNAGLDYARRPTRCLPQQLRVELSEGDARFSFTLPRGQFATAVLREIIQP